MEGSTAAANQDTKESNRDTAPLDMLATAATAAVSGPTPATGRTMDTTDTTTTRLGTGTRTAAIGAAEAAAAAVASQPGSDPAGSGRHLIMASQGFGIYLLGNLML